MVLESIAAVYPEVSAERYRKADESLIYTQIYDEEENESLEIQLLKFVRIDEYMGYNEEFAIVINEKPNVCVPLWPAEISDLELKDKELAKALDELKNDLVLRLAPADSSYFDVCNNYDQICQSWGILLFSNKLILFSDWNDEKEITLHTEDSSITLSYFDMSHNSGEYLSLANATLYYPSTSYSCYSSSSSLSLICPCKK